MISEVCGVYIINSTAVPQGATGCHRVSKVPQAHVKTQIGPAGERQCVREAVIYVLAEFVR